ncbi:MAG TPA: hypothetical protein VN969_01425 [Streptosporangiaceae bacterium]|nr:hypothetical protein [Streptosporangiaceae bacterium]
MDEELEESDDDDDDEELTESDFFSVFSVDVLADESLPAEEPLPSFAFAAVAAEEPLRLSVR